jgi:hypothetical protein
MRVGTTAPIQCETLAARLHITSAKEIFMNAQHKVFASVGIMLLVATASFAQQVKTDYDRSTDFSQYKTYCN